MIDAMKTAETKAIREVIAEGGAMDYIDVVDAVRKKYGLSVSSALVEKVHLQMRREAKTDVQPRIKLEMGRTAPTEPAEVESEDHLAHALRFVKSVHGLKNAKRALAELEAMMRELRE